MANIIEDLYTPGAGIGDEALIRLMQLAEEATPGPWLSIDGCGREGRASGVFPASKSRGSAIAYTHPCGTTAKANAEYIAAACPDYVYLMARELLARRAAEGK
uniref:Uncharacterized protein n=1 Tax=uncultured Caudovirales phage TaxID=2100421 RepID=A0A6J5L688_9CAUD|nr:hypothetical protein UFOVP114_12 [uncultured Caudovirales phage]